MKNFDTEEALESFKAAVKGVGMKIYLISPYSHSDESVREERYDAAVDATAALIKRGNIVFSPIVHCHPLALKHSLPKDHVYWKKYDQAFIEWADVGYVLRIPGWKGSLGVMSDIKALCKLGKSVFDSDSDPL